MKNWKLIPDWRESWKWLSMRAMAINTAFLATWALIPQKFQDAINENYVLGIAIALLMFGMAGRLKQQDKPEATPDIPAAEKLSE